MNPYDPATSTFPMLRWSTACYHLVSIEAAPPEEVDGGHEANLLLFTGWLLVCGPCRNRKLQLLKVAALKAQLEQKYVYISLYHCLFGDIISSGASAHPSNNCLIRVINLLDFVLLENLQLLTLTSQQRYLYPLTKEN